MRVLVLTSLYSTPSQPARSPPNARIVHAMKQHAQVRVVAPVPYYPPLLALGRRHLEEVMRVPDVELDVDGEEVLHPRYAHIPKLGRSFYPSLYALSLFEVIAREVASFRPNVLMSAWAFPDGVAAAVLAKLFGLPSVLRVMGSDVNTLDERPTRRIQVAWALRNVTRVVAVSAALKARCGSLVGASDHIDVIPTGVDTRIFFPTDRAHARKHIGLSDLGRLIVVPARLSPEKGLSDFIEAFARLDGDVVAVVLGEGPEERSLRAQTERLGIEKRVIFAGFRRSDEMRLFYSAADLVCLPSTEEGWPNVLIESFACGCPWVASNVGGVPEILNVASAGGLLAAPSDPTDLARALRAGLERSWDREEIAECARTLTLDETGRSYVETCRMALSDAQGKQGAAVAAG
jgi:teichuronic acid biosynthesis glycosyltransferase TuaC